MDEDDLSRAVDAGPERPSVPLGKLAMKTTVEELVRFLDDPLAVRPSGRMPHMNLQPGEAHLLAAYLLREQMVKDEKGWGVGIDYAIYHGSFPNVPDFRELTPIHEGNAKQIDLAAVLPADGKLKSNFAVRFYGAINIPLIPQPYTPPVFSSSGSGCHI